MKHGLILLCKIGDIKKQGLIYVRSEMSKSKDWYMLDLKCQKARIDICQIRNIKKQGLIYVRSKTSKSKDWYNYVRSKMSKSKDWYMSDRKCQKPTMDDTWTMTVKTIWELQKSKHG